jgi:hypothetical protein
MFSQPHGKILRIPAFELELVFDFYSFFHRVAGITISGKIFEANEIPIKKLIFFSGRATAGEGLRAWCWK